MMTASIAFHFFTRIRSERHLVERMVAIPGWAAVSLAVVSVYTCRR